MVRRTDSEDFMAVNIYQDVPKAVNGQKKKEVRFTLDHDEAQDKSQNQNKPKTGFGLKLKD